MPNEDKYSKPQQPKGNQKITAVALGVVTCLFMGGLGYEIIQMKQEKAKVVVESRKSVSPPKRSSYDEPADEDEEYLSYELNVLKEQNRRQAAKIRSLKQELVNKLQEQHDLKSTLFKQEGDPRDRARIAELSQQLAQKEMASLQLQHQLRDLEAEKQGFDKRLLHAQVTNEALTSMLDQHRSVKDQEITKLKSQLTEIQKQKDTEIQEISMQLLQYEDTHQRLKGSQEENSHIVFYLNGEIKQLTAQLEDLQRVQRERESALYEQLYNAVASSELTEIQAATLKAQLNKAYSSHSESIQDSRARIAQLEQEAAEHQQKLKEKNALVESVHDLYNIALVQTRTEIEEVSSQFESEKNKSQSLEQELARQLATKQTLQQKYEDLKRDHQISTEVEKQLRETIEKMTLLQTELDIHKFSLAEREQHLDQLQQIKSTLESRYQEKVQELTHALKTEQELKSGKELEIEYLTNRLEIENTRHQQTRHSLESALYQSQEQLDREKSAHEQTRQALMNQNQRAAEQDRSYVEQELRQQIADLTAALRNTQAELQELAAGREHECQEIARLNAALDFYAELIDSKEETLRQYACDQEELQCQLSELMQSSRARETAEANRFEKFNVR